MCTRALQIVEENNTIKRVYASKIISQANQSGKPEDFFGSLIVALQIYYENH